MNESGPSYLKDEGKAYSYSYSYSCPSKFEVKALSWQLQFANSRTAFYINCFELCKLLSVVNRPTERKIKRTSKQREEEELFNFDGQTERELGQNCFSLICENLRVPKINFKNSETISIFFTKIIKILPFFLQN